MMNSLLKFLGRRDFSPVSMWIGDQLTIGTYGTRYEATSLTRNKPLIIKSWKDIFVALEKGFLREMKRYEIRWVDSIIGKDKEVKRFGWR